MKHNVRIGRRTVTVTENLIDRAVRYFSPVRGQERFKARVQTAIAGAYVGGSQTRRSLKSWFTRGNSADADLLPDLPTLRERSRDLIRNNSLACGAINTKVTSIVGPGLMLRSEIDHDYLGLTDDQADEWESSVERLFRLWSRSQNCDATRTQNFNDLQSLAFRSTLENGDVFALLPVIKRPGWPVGLAVNLVEADRVSNPNYQQDTEALAGGVELDDNGAPIAYHVAKYHPGGLSRRFTEWQRVRAFGQRSDRRQVLHLFTRLRPGQTRGVPDLAPVIEPLKQLGEYTDAELMAAVVSGMFTVFVKSEGDPSLSLDEFAAETGGSTSTSGTPDDDLKLGHGAIAYLGNNDSIESANPNRPNTAFDPFVMSILQQVGVALELPVEVLIKHFQSSYSAARASLLEAWRFFKMRRAWLAAHFCDPVYAAFVDECVATGLIDAPGYFDDVLIRQAYLGAQWIGRPQGHIQPLQEAEALDQRIRTGVSTIEKEAIELDGSDFDRLHKQRAKEHRLRLAAGLEEDVNAVSPAPDLAALQDNQ
jgi:lambda family phage portal protein